MRASPLLFEPIYKPRIWGGDRIFTHFGRTRPSDEPIGESWELADLEEDQSRVRDGALRGRTLEAIRAAWGADLLGDSPLFEGRFPLLIKFLDAATSLSVQVHPTAAVARRLGGSLRVKHEAWYILAAEAGGAIWHGLEPGVTAESFRRAMRSGQVEGVLRRVPVRAGQCYDLPSGTVHALGAGVLVAEIQTPSDVTYRAYDWGRTDPATGRPRALHLDEAIECIDFAGAQPAPMQAPAEVGAAGQSVWRLAACESFAIDRIEVPAGGSRPARAGQMCVWIVLEGAGRCEGAEPEVFERGDVWLVPAAAKGCVRADERATLLEVTVPG